MDQDKKIIFFAMLGLSCPVLSFAQDTSSGVSTCTKNAVIVYRPSKAQVVRVAEEALERVAKERADTDANTRSEIIVGLTLNVSPEGHVKGVSISKSSGYVAVDLAMYHWAYGIEIRPQKCPNYDTYPVFIDEKL